MVSGPAEARDYLNELHQNMPDIQNRPLAYWTIVDEVRPGRVELETIPGAVTSTFIPEWLQGEDRAEAWRRYGIRGAVEDYM